MSLTAIIVCFVSLLSVSTTDEIPRSSLLFGASRVDYVSFRFDYPSMATQFSACIWIKPLDPAYKAMAWSYWGGSGTYTYGYPGYQNAILGDSSLRGNLGSYFDGVPRGTWLHLCHTWQYDRDFKVFLDGEHIATSSGSTGRRMVAGTMKLGNWAGGSSAYSDYVFGGEMTNFNMFRRELTNTEILRLYQGGVCYLDPLTDNDRALKWEDILTFSRSGNVTEVDLSDTRQECGPSMPGDVGMKGDQGMPGDDGVDGPDGENGYCDAISGACEGESGDAGPPGDTGDKGEHGEAGLRGSDGADGADGAPGERGVIGPRGETGIKGESGEIGEDGDTAESNCDGSSRCKLGLGRCYATSSSRPLVKCRLGFAATSIWKNSDFFGLLCCEVIKIAIDDDE